jgi:hypothetical protein
MLRLGSYERLTNKSPGFAWGILTQRDDAVEHLQKFLAPKIIKLEQLLLDCNNPRFAELGQATYAKMKAATFDVKELRDTIHTIGFLPMDRMVVRIWAGSEGGNEKYVVLEGNRRLTAVMWLLELHESGKETLTEEEVLSFQNIECLVLDTAIAPESAHTILPGLRHVSGIKEWGPYQKAKAIFGLRQTGLSPQEVAQSLGLSTRASNAAYRCYIALEQMKSDEEYGEYADPRMYSYFEEIFKKRNVKDWLGWNDTDEEFTNNENLVEFYSWITQEGDEEEPPKIPTALGIRELSTFIDDPDALGIFRGKDGSLSRALAKFEIDHPGDWYPKITAAITAIQSLTPDVLRNINEQSLKSLESLREKIDRALKDRSKLMSPD